MCALTPHRTHYLCAFNPVRNSNALSYDVYQGDCYKDVLAVSEAWFYRVGCSLCCMQICLSRLSCVAR